MKTNLMKTVLRKTVFERTFKRTIGIQSILLALIFATLTSAQSAVASPRVHVGSAIAAPGELVGINVYLGGNTDGFTGARIPLRYNSTDVTPDSVSVVGSILDPRMAAVKSIDTDSGYFGVLIIPPFAAPFPTVTVDSGLICTFWFTVSQSAVPQNIIFDSLNTVDTISPELLQLRRVEFVDPTGLITFIPSFSRGTIQLLSTDVEDDIVNSALPREFALNQNYPNPFNPNTKIGFALPKSSAVTLDVFNLLGQRVTTLFSGELGAGNHEVEWDASDSPSGVYFYRIKSGLGVKTKKMVLLK